jgi:hypothetical protein
MIVNVEWLAQLKRNTKCFGNDNGKQPNYCKVFEVCGKLLKTARVTYGGHRAMGLDSRTICIYSYDYMVKYKTCVWSHMVTVVQVLSQLLLLLNGRCWVRCVYCGSS